MCLLSERDIASPGGREGDKERKMRRYRRGKNRCEICGFKLDDGNNHDHAIERMYRKLLMNFVMKPCMFAKVLKMPEPNSQLLHFRRFEDAVR